MQNNIEDLKEKIEIKKSLTRAAISVAIRISASCFLNCSNAYTNTKKKIREET
jgi:hypothetical protein